MKVVWDEATTDCLTNNRRDFPQTIVDYPDQPPTAAG